MATHSDDASRLLVDSVKDDAIFALSLGDEKDAIPIEPVDLRTRERQPGG